ncbi:MAG: hypothetical protein PWP21_360 [Thermosediminibacterales bacterium]|nr:hypothetical protein [Thermosediminibacterales bacterium]
MQYTLVFGLIFALLVAIFAISNSTEVVIKFPWGNYPVSQAIVILGSAVLGAVVVFLFGIVNQVKSRIKLWDTQKKVKNYEKEIKELKERLEKAEAEMSIYKQNIEKLDKEGLEKQKTQNEQPT